MPPLIILRDNENKFYVARQMRDGWEFITSKGIFAVSAVAIHDNHFRDDLRTGFKPVFGKGKEGRSTVNFKHSPEIESPKEFIGKYVYFGISNPQFPLPPNVLRTGIITEYYKAE